MSWLLIVTLSVLKIEGGDKMKENKMNKKQIGFIFSLIGGVLWVETLLLIW